MLLLSHPAINAYTRNISRALAEAGLLQAFHTSVALREGGGWSRWLPGRAAAELTRRSLPPELWPQVRRHPLRELGRLVTDRLGVRGLSRHESGPFCVDAVYHALDRATARALSRADGTVRAVYCGEDAAAETFRVARSRGLRCLYDLPIAYHRTLQRLLAEERERLPEFAGTFQGREDSAAKLARKVEEANAADLIVACSDFVGESLRAAGFAPEKIRVIPYGGPAGITPREPPTAVRPLRLLYAGSIGQRKGIGDLLHALRRLGRRDVDLVIMGSWVGNAAEALRPWSDLFRYEAPRPHAAVLDLMRSCDVLVLPSIVEGFALVIAEAMACGLPVVVTPNTGAAPIVRDGLDGWYVPIRDPDALAQRLDWLADHREAVAEAGRSARARIEEHSWARFRTAMAELGREQIALAGR
ncbi:MAG: glycosyltransferase family 4 protein [Verrucomicrobia bacterium]|nr:glycosyltransferase family 4 protein [Verrucomicrobiota bacterium]